LTTLFGHSHWLGMCPGNSMQQEQELRLKAGSFLGSQLTVFLSFEPRISLRRVQTLFRQSGKGVNDDT